MGFAFAHSKLTLTIQSIIYGKEIYGCFILLKHPSDTSKSIKYELIGTFSLMVPFIKKDCSINVIQLEKEGFIDEGILKLEITFSRYPQPCEGLQQLSVKPNVCRIIRCILKPHQQSQLPNITKEEIQWICASAADIFLSEKPLLKLSTPLIIVGDLHGKYYDLIHIFVTHGFPDSTTYLFLGDYVDRGKDSIDVILLLFALKIRFPKKIYLIRGNHEVDTTAKRYGFFAECQAKDVDFGQFIAPFDSLPLAAIINRSIFCVHGAISPTMFDTTFFKKWTRGTL
jgi:hypothetical protein